MKKGLALLLALNIGFGGSAWGAEVGAMESLFMEVPQVISASLREESTNETPVVVNVVTKEQIRRMGAKTLNDLLGFIPGFMPMPDADEANFGVRGIYGSTQQTALVMRDGHSLHHLYLHAADPGHNISLVGVERVEIMRGPGGSLYGNIAQTAVINLISEKGGDLNGMTVDVGGGNYGQRQVDVTYGKESDDGDFMAYAHFYKTGGEVRDMPAEQDLNTPANARAGQVVLGGINVDTARDVGFRNKVKDFTFVVMNSYSGAQSARSSTGTRGALIYPLEFDGFRGFKPGLALTRTNLYSDYDKRFDNGATLKVRLSLDDMTIAAHHVNWTGGQSVASSVQTSFDVDERVWGFKSHLTAPLRFRDRDGDVLFGVQAIHHEVYNVDPLMKYRNDTGALSLEAPWLPAGSEYSYASFFQVKQRLSEKLLMNAGARYDYFLRIKRPGDLERKEIKQVSPRTALIFDPIQSVNMKFSYTRSFKDASYWYRNNTASGFFASSGELQPELVDTYQVSVSHIAWQRLVNRAGYFYNKIRDAVVSTGSGPSTVYRNSGDVTIDGLEYETEYKRSRAQVRANYTYTRLIKATSPAYPQANGAIKYWPSHMGSAILDVKPLASQDLWVEGAMRYLGRQQSPTANLAGAYMVDTGLEIGGFALFNAKVTWDNIFRPGLGVGLKVENLMDKDYRLSGGNLAIPFEQPGRWWFLDVSYKF